jgi:hypothetical protein
MRQGRVNAIDFWRGCILCVIFIDHMPGIAFEDLTPRNFGFSDAAEAFVFLSGLSTALAYGGHFSASQRTKTLGAVARRVLKLYGVHVALSLVALALFVGAATWANKPELVSVHGRDLFVANPGVGLIGLLSLGHQLGYFNILPLYMVLIACAPALLALAAIDQRLMLACSAALYGLVQFYHWNLPNWPSSGGWFFDPFAWQFLFAIGIAVGLRLRQAPPPISVSLTAATGVIVIASVVAVSASHEAWAQGSWDLIRDRLHLDKSILGPGRLIHFLSLAYLIYVLKIARRLHTSPLYSPLVLIGRHSLTVFVLVSLFSAVWQILTEMIDRSIAFDAAFVVSSIAVIYGAVLTLDSIRASNKSRTVRPILNCAGSPASSFEPPFRELIS